MAKSFACRRTPEGMAVIEDTIAHLRQATNQAEKEYGWDCPETLEFRVLLAAMYCVSDHYEEVEPLLTGYSAVRHGKPASSPRWLFWVQALLIEAYVKLNRIAEAIRISNEGRAAASKIETSGSDPFLNALAQWSMALEAKRDIESRQRGFVVALITLCWYVSHGFDRSPADAHVKKQLRVLFQSYGLLDKDWEWAEKHAHLTKYDFIGFVSILLHHTSQAASRLDRWIERSPRVVKVR